MTQTQKLSKGTLIGLAVIIGILLGANYLTKVLGANPVANLSAEYIDIIGTRVGTTTTSVAYGPQSATTTYPVQLQERKTDITLYLESLASSTAAIGNVSLNLVGSNDQECYTASTTSGTMNPIIAGNIHWYDIASNIRGASGLTSIPSATTTISWATNGKLNGRTLILEGVNAKCFAIQVSASSTELHVSAMTSGERN